MEKITEHVQNLNLIGKDGQELPTPAVQLKSYDPEMLKVLTDLELTDDGNAHRLARFSAGNFRYVPEEAAWFFWTGQRWEKDQNGGVIRELRKMRKMLKLSARKMPKGKERNKLFKVCTALEGGAKIKSAIELARSIDGIPLRISEFNTNTWLLNVPNGTLDLLKGQLDPHKRENLITKMAGTPFVPDATCPVFEKFIWDFCCGDKDLISYIKRVVGYSLTGEVKEQVIHLLVGEGANGKTTLLDLLRKILGDYAKVTDFTTFLESKSDRIRNDLASLVGARLVLAVEADPDRAISESTIKQVSGDDAITARFLFKEFFSFKPQFKIFLAANHLPRVKRNDKAIWRRFRLIWAKADFSAETIRDREMSKKLENELPGILSWAVEGCLEWQKIGLNPPSSVINATSDYRQQEDTVSAFIADNCIIGPEAKVKPRELYNAYVFWCEGVFAPLSLVEFAGQIRGLKFQQRKSGSLRWWIGIGIKLTDIKLTDIL